MNGVFTRKLRLRPTILTLFVLLTVPVFLTIVAVTYLSNDSLARSHANDLVTRFRADAISNIQDMFDPIKSLVRSAAAIGNEQPDFYASNRSLKYLFSILVHSNKIISMYVGAADGSFRQARRIDPNVMIQGKLPPQGSKYAYRWIDRAKGATPIDHYVLLDATEAEIGTSEEATGYDPRPRLWYRRTVEDKSLLITDPDVFAALGLIGFTVAAPFYADGKIAGVAAADITLDGLSEYLSENKISPGTVSYILDNHGGVIANSERAKTLRTKTDGWSCSTSPRSMKSCPRSPTAHGRAMARRCSRFREPATNTLQASLRCRRNSASNGSSLSSRHWRTSRAHSTSITTGCLSLGCWRSRRRS